MDDVKNLLQYILQCTVEIRRQYVPSLFVGLHLILRRWHQLTLVEKQHVLKGKICKSAVEWDKLHWKLSFGEVNCRFYGCFTAPLTGCCKTKFLAINPKIYLPKDYMSHCKTKPTKWLCAQRRLRSAWASILSDQSLLSAWRKLGSLATQWVHSEDWSDWADAQADLSLHWAHSHFVGFVMLRLNFKDTYPWPYHVTIKMPSLGKMGATK